jgi:DNA-binding transcriptional ArsR family regulator
MRTSAPGLLPLFRSEAQLVVLGAIFTAGEKRWTISALAEHLHLPISTTSREVGQLAQAGILTTIKEGRNTLVSPNWDLPWARTLAALLDQTIGPQALISQALHGIKGVEEAWIFGSWAARQSGEVGPAPRDIDLLLVGDDINRFQVADALDDVSRRVGVEVNPHTVAVSEWRHPAAGSFVEDLKHVPLVRVPLGASGG